MTVAAFMDLALYHPELGYYARAGQRSGRAGDFFTSVDVGPLFGELLEVQIAEMFQLLTINAETAEHPEKRSLSANSATSAFDLIEAGAGNGRLSADILRTAKRRDPGIYERVRLHLVEASERARGGQRATLGDAAERLGGSGPHLPESFEGVLFANELLDAMPVHAVVMRAGGLRELYVEADPRHGALTTVEGPLSSPSIAEYLEHVDARLQPGWHAEIGLAATRWIAGAARRLRRGFIILIDYGHAARELYSVSHSTGTLTTFSRHRAAGPESGTPAWLANPGEQDITAHVDFTSVQRTAEAEGLTTIAFLDQTYFLLGLLPSISIQQSAVTQFKTLMMPGGLGSTQKVLILGKNVGVPTLKGTSFKVRVT